MILAHSVHLGCAAAEHKPQQICQCLLKQGGALCSVVLQVNVSYAATWYVSACCRFTWLYQNRLCSALKPNELVQYRGSKHSRADPPQVND